MSVIEEIIEQHAEIAASSWLSRDAAVGDPHYSLSDIADLDDRVEANIDGLRIAEDEGWKIAKEALEWEEAGEVFTAAVLAFESGNPDRIHNVIEVAGDDPELARGIISALGWLSYPRAEKSILYFLDSESPLLQRIGIAACAVHRKDPGKTLYDGLSSSDPYLRSRALKTIGELGKTDFAAVVKDHLDEEDKNCRFHAALSSSLLGSMAGLPVLLNIAEKEGRLAESACSIALRRMIIAEGHDWIKAIAKKTNLQRIALIGAGAIGDPVLVPWLIENMSIPDMARVAGEAFTMITGVDMVNENLEGEWPKGFEAGPTENPEDEDVEMDPDEDLPWPEPELIDNWWNDNNKKFRNGARYLCGKPISEQQYQYVLRYGYQRQRAAAAIILSLMHPSQPLFEVRAPGFRQQKILGLKQ